MHGALGATGAILGGGLGVLARRQGPRGEARVLAAGLAVAAAVYVAFALAGGARGTSLALQAAGLAGFGGVALLGVRHSPWWLAAGWAVHAAWDIGLPSATAPPFVPAWYPPLCVGFDLAVAVWIAARAAALRTPRGDQADA